MDRLSLLDASFLQRERPATPLHTGGIGVFGPELTFDRVRATLEGRVGRVARGRQRVLAAHGAGRPVWVDDADFDLTYHLRHAALPTPGSRAQLTEFVARLMARPLDRGRPLWEIYVIEGLEGGGVAVFRKVHVAMAGGDRGDPFGVLLDEQPDAAGDADPERWEAVAPPSPLALAAGAVRDGVERTAVVGRGAARLATSPSTLTRVVGGAVGDAVGLVARLAGSPPRSPLNAVLSAHRRLATLRAPLEDLRTVRRAFGGSINDVVVAVTGDAVGRLLRHRGYETTDLDLRVMVPVRVGDSGDQPDPGGQPGSSAARGGAQGLGASQTVGHGVVGVIAPLPVMHMDPVARLYRVMGEMAGLKESRQAVAADNLTRIAGFAPSNLHSAAARLVTAEQRYNIALSNAPGPQSPRYLAGVPMVESYGFLPLAGDSSLSVAVSSYAGSVSWGLVGERSAMADLDVLAGFVPEALQELVDAAAAAA